MKSVRLANAAAKVEPQAVENGAKRKRIAVTELSRSGETKVDSDFAFARACGPYWIHVAWRIGEKARQRARAALGVNWYRAALTARIVDVTPDDSGRNLDRSSRHTVLRPGSREWFFEVSGAPRAYRIEVGYSAQSGRFLALVRSNTVASILPGCGERSDHCKPIRSNSTPNGAESDAGGLSAQVELADREHRNDARRMRERQFGSIALELETEMVVRGQASGCARVSVLHADVRTKSNGAFAVRLPIGDGRLVVPIVASSLDGMDRRIAVISVERNLRWLDPNSLDGD